jgi:DNA gyrase/topoisomerase IV subunit B
MTVSDIEAIRLRPGMYVGGVDESGIHHLLWELVANALDEHVAGREEDIVVEVALTWSDPWRESVESFANVYRTTGGGTHVRGLRLGLLAAIRATIPTARGQSTRMLERAIAPGLIAAVCVRLNDPSFGGPTRDVLSTPRVATIVKHVLARELARHIAGHPAVRDFIDGRIRAVSRA